MVGRILTASLYGVGFFFFYVGLSPVVRWLGKRNPQDFALPRLFGERVDDLAGLDCTTSPAIFRKHMFVSCEELSGRPSPDDCRRRRPTTCSRHHVR